MQSIIFDMQFNSNKGNLLRCHCIQIRKHVFYHLDHVYVDFKNSKKPPGKVSNFLKDDITHEGEKIYLSPT